VIWLATAALSRRSSVGSLAAFAAAPPLALYLPLLWAPGAEALGDRQLAVFAAILAIAIWAKHHANIARLLAGQEPKIGKR
jgi:glycerol-3-phosphate acyltransferase PlsY